MIICQVLQKCQINYLLRILYLVKFYTNTTLFLYLTSLWSINSQKLYHCLFKGVYILAFWYVRYFNNDIQIVIIILAVHKQFLNIYVNRTKVNDHSVCKWNSGVYAIVYRMRHNEVPLQKPNILYRNEIFFSHERVKRPPCLTAW